MWNDCFMEGFNRADQFGGSFMADIHTPDTGAVSWPAIFAGGTAAAAVTFMLVTLGSAVGLSSISPWSNSGVSAGTFKISAGIFVVVVAMIASTIGGYIAGRLRTKWNGAHSEEVLFRDTAHGFLAWAFATAFGVLVLGAASTALIGGVAAGASAGGAQAASTAAASPTDYFVDSLLRREGTAATPPQGDNAAARAEVNRIFMRGFAQPDGVSTADQTYLAQMVASRTGRSQQEAQVRVTEVINGAKAAVDEARRFSAATALWLTLAMFVGAFSASFAALEGGQLRDGRWSGVIFRGGYQTRNR
jgi:hypothetical protein